MNHALIHIDAVWPEKPMNCAHAGDRHSIAIVDADGVTVWLRRTPVELVAYARALLDETQRMRDRVTVVEVVS
jgi:hypothetical protein